MSQCEDELLNAVETRFFGKYRGTVADPSEPDQQHRGRLQVIVHGVTGKQAIWALPCVPYAGPDVGMFFLPEPGTHVWVEFEAGDLSYPIWSGCFWKAGDLADTSPGRRFIRTKEFSLEIDDDAGTLTIKANGGGAQIVMTRNQIELEAAGDISTTVSSRKTKLNVQRFSVNDGALEVT